MLQLAELERHLLGRRVEIATFIAAGASDLELPSWDEARAAFVAELASDPSKADSGLRLLRELGVA